MAGLLGFAPASLPAALLVVAVLRPRHSDIANPSPSPRHRYSGIASPSTPPRHRT